MEVAKVDVCSRKVLNFPYMASRTTPFDVQTVPGYPESLQLYCIPASSFWQIRMLVDRKYVRKIAGHGRSDRRQFGGTLCSQPSLTGHVAIDASSRDARPRRFTSAFGRSSPRTHRSVAR